MILSPSHGAMNREEGGPQVHDPNRGSAGPLEVALVLRLRAAGCVFAEDEARLLVGSGLRGVELEHLVQRRVMGEPLEHILGWVDFCGLRLAVGPGVFVPRQRSALLVECAAEVTPEGATVLDLCCGCGALGAALACLVGGIALHATDISSDAVGLARENLPAGAQCYEGDLFGALPAALRGTVHTLLCNSPYVPSDQLRTLPPEARLHEPRATLDGGADGLDIHRRVAAEARAWLRPGGHLLFEVSDEQETAGLGLLQEQGFRAWSRDRAEMGATVVIGRAPA